MRTIAGAFRKTGRHARIGQRLGAVAGALGPVGRFALAGTLGTLAGALGAAAADPGAVAGGGAAVAVPAEIFLVDAQSLNEERAELKVVDSARDALGRSGAAVLYAPAVSRELALREAGLAALQKNLDIGQSRIGVQIARRALDEADAVFDPVLAATFSAALRTEFLRVESPDKRFRPPTETVAVGQTDSKGIFLCTQAAANITVGSGRGQVCHVVTFDPAGRSAVLANQFLTARPEGKTPSFPIDAHRPARTQPRHEDILTGAVSLFQQLPWGPSVNLTVQTRRDETFFTLGGIDPLQQYYGNYQRPYFTSITLGASLPLPFSRNFGPMASADVNRRIARDSIDAAEFTVRATINDTLLEVDTVYWTLVGSLQRLKVTLESQEVARRQRASIRRLYDEGLVSESDLAQADGQVARIQTALQQIFGEYVATSEAMRQLVAAEEEVLYLPTGYRSLLRLPPQPLQEAEQVVNNPAYQRQGVAVRIAALTNEQRRVQTRPNLTGTASAQLAQGGLYGYRSALDSLEAIFEPDLISVTFALNYIYPIGNRADEAAYRGAQHALARQRLLLEQVELTLRETYGSALATLRSARERVRLTAKTVDFAEKVYGRSVRLQEEVGEVAVYETLNRLIDLLNARLANIQAQVEARIAESQLLASVGALAERYGERTAQTEADRGRLAMLRATGALQHFGGPL